jgi:nucleotide-binding universal stress UspA family protein
MFQRILVPLDGSTRAEQALPIVARLARATTGTVILLRVDTTPEKLIWYSGQAAPMMQETLEAEHSRAVEYLTHLLSSELLDGIATSMVTVEGEAAHGILVAAKEHQADLIVISSHGYTGLKRWMVGSVAQKVARHSPLPVLVLRSIGEKEVSLPPVGERPVRVMVPLDGSILAEAALKPAAVLSQALSAPRGGALSLVQVLPIATHAGVIADEVALMPVPGGVRVGPALASEPEKAEMIAARKAQALNEAHTYLSSVKSTFLKEENAAQDFQVTTSEVVDADIASTLIELAESNQKSGMYTSNVTNICDVIAMATHGRSGLMRWIMGSITERVLGATRLPLLIVQPPQNV